MRFVSLSFDPARDTPEIMACYGRSFSKDTDWAFVTTRSMEALAPILAAYDQRLTRDPGAAGGFAYLLRVFLIDEGGYVRNIYIAYCAECNVHAAQYGYRLLRPARSLRLGSMIGLEFSLAYGGPRSVSRLRSERFLTPAAFDQGVQKQTGALARLLPGRVARRPPPRREPHPEKLLTVLDENPEVADQGLNVPG